MKKTLVLLIAIFGLFLFSACQESTPDIKDYTKSFINDYMDTYIRIDYATDDADLAAEIALGVEDILAHYHDLTNNYEGPRDVNNSPNIYEINQRIGETIAIDPDLYDILVLSEELKTLTDGYFDIGIGKLVDLWKAEIEHGYENNTMTEMAFNAVTAASDALDFSGNVIDLSVDGYITTAGEHLKLDLGAIAKGYATQKLREYLMDKELVYFMINSGTSSFVFGENRNRDTGLYHIGLEDPMNTGVPYGVVYVKNTSITTSGNFVQYVMYNELRYHHIVSPLTKRPEQYYHTLSLIADDAGVLDALSTALFSMSPSVLSSWLEEHQTDLGLEVISYNYDLSISTYLIDTVFEEQ